MGINKKIRTLEDNIVALLNASDIPVEAKRLVVSEVNWMLTKESDKVVTFEVKREVFENGSKEDQDL